MGSSHPLAGEGLSQNRVLIIDTDPVLRYGICSFLAAQGHIVSEAANCRDAQLLLQRLRPHVVVLDLYLPNGDTPELLRLAKSMEPKVPVLLLAGRDGSETRARALSNGADQVLPKPVDLGQLHAVLLRLLAQPKRPEAPIAPGARSQRECLDPFIGTSVAVRRLREIANRVLSSESPILLQGETGAGKGVLANWIHRNGPRAEQPFLDLNCAGLSRELLESELFGHEKGAFTSAVSAKPGLLEVANHGTVFLDEIGDIDLQVQPKLLKVLEDRVCRRLGEVRDRAVDIRLISATHRELLDLVRQQRFRSDLYFRVNIVYLQVPPLRDRTDDIAPLAEHLVRSIARQRGQPPMRISGAAMAALERYSWPGNIRELRNVLERAAVITGHDGVKPEHLHLQAASDSGPSRSVSMSGTLKQMERAYIHHVLDDEGGSIERTARRLGIPRSSLYNKMKRFEIPQGTGRE
jgi:DNA-binding NtrC family response regulator